MIIQELFQKVKYEDFLHSLEKKMNLKIEQDKQIKKIFHELKEYTKTTLQNKVLFAIPIKEVNENRVDIFYFDKNNFPQNLQIYRNIEEMQDNYQNQGISILGIDRYELLGFEFAEICLKELSFPEIVSELFFEITFFGLDYETSNTEIKKIQEELSESLNDVENDKSIPFEDFLSELGIKDERTEEEKELEKNKLLENCLKSINKTNRIILNYLKKE